MAYHPGDHLALCDICGFQFLRSELRRNYRNFLVCKDDYEDRHPQDRPIVGKGEAMRIPGAKPEPDDQFVTMTVAEQREAL